MLIFGEKCMYPCNGRPVFGAVKLLKDAQISLFKSGNLQGQPQWSAFGAFESAPKGMRGEGNTVGITTQFNVQLAKRLIPFSRGETLLVAGYWQKDEWRSKKEGKNIYMIVAEFVIAQPDYSQFYAVEDGGEGMEEETDDVGF